MAGPLANSDGSAVWERGASPRQIRFICSVNGPLEPKVRDELPQLATLSIEYRRNVGVPKIRERLIQDRIYASVLASVKRELLPRSLIQIVVQLLESWRDEDTSFVAELAEGINVTTLALVDAGVPLNGLVAAASYAVTASQGVVPVAGADSPRKLEAVTSTHAVAFRFVGDEAPQIIVCESVGDFSEDELVAVLTRAENDARSIAQEMRNRITAAA